MKQDRKRISRQKYEIAYVRSIAKKLLKLPYTGKKERRMCKAVLKFVK